MTTRRHNVLLGFAACGFAMAIAAVACGLNPQPLPPGETGDPDAGSVFGTPVGNSAADAGVSGSIGDGGTTPPPSIGEAGDAEAGAADATTDAASDGSEDAPSDGASEDGG